MPVTKIAVIYSVAQSKRRRIVICDDDKDYQHHLLSLHKEEGVWMMPLAEYNAALSIDDCLEKHLGKAAVSDRCVIVDGDGCVISGLCGDPKIDVHPSGEIIQHEEACVGWRNINNEWIAPSVSIDEPVAEIIFCPDTLTTSIPAGILGTNWQIRYQDNNLTIGCETHTIDEWNNFKDSRIKLMDEAAMGWWNNYKFVVMAKAAEHIKNCYAVGRKNP